MQSTTLRRLPLAAGSAALLLALSACGSSEDSAASDAQAPDTAAGQGAGAGFPGASGTIAAVSGTVMQVQSQQNGQVAVTWNAKTSFTKQVKASLSDVEAGDCVVATAGGEASAGADSSSLTATTVRISDAGEDGTCDGGFGAGRRGGTPPSGAPTDMPSGAPTDMPSGAPSGGPGGGFGAGAFGKVTAVAKTGFTVKSSAPGGASTTSVEVAVSAATTYSATGKATAAAVKTGGCATATGDSDDTGAIIASQVALSDPVDGQCGMGFGGGPGPGQGS